MAMQGKSKILSMTSKEVNAHRAGKHAIVRMYIELRFLSLVPSHRVTTALSISAFSLTAQLGNGQRMSLDFTTSARDLATPQ